ncbi:MAG: M20/M25/M40 family metallo-hydrolase [Holophagales bacterium]|nr:M20/M25/M40 family metallo-hydrolase [Holophagales bacterium]
MSRSRALLLLSGLGLIAAGGPAAAGAFPPAVERLRAYVRLDTSNPPGNEIRGALYLKELLARGGVASEIFEPEPGRANLYARLRGTGSAPGLVLHHHIDVVPASAAGWLRPPFAAVVFNDLVLHGRGVLDTKGLGIAQLEAFLALKRSGRAPARDVVFLATADEERGGRLGVSAVYEKRPAWLAGVGEVLGEGRTSRRSSTRPVVRHRGAAEGGALAASRSGRGRARGVRGRVGDRPRAWPGPPRDSPR